MHEYFHGDCALCKQKLGFYALFTLQWRKQSGIQAYFVTMLFSNARKLKRNEMQRRFFLLEIWFGEVTGKEVEVVQ